MKKILVFAPYYPPHPGGLEQYACSLNEELCQHGISVTVFTPHIPHSAPAEERSTPQQMIIRYPAVEIVPTFPFPFILRPMFFKLVRDLSAHKYSLILSHTRFFFPTFMAMLYAKITGTKWLHIEHGSDFVQASSIFISLGAKAYDLLLGRLVLSSADLVLCISNAVNTFVRELAPKAKRITAYRGFNAHDIERIKPNKSIRPLRKHVITYIGRLISGKGVADLLHAFSSIPRSRCRLLILGDGPEISALKKLAAHLQIQDDVTFMGAQPYVQAIAVLKASDVFVNPSYTEGLPTTVIEAAFCRKAIIATNVGGTAEIITNDRNGVLIEPRQPAMLAAALTHLLQDAALRRRLGSEAYSTVSKKFNWRRCISAIERMCMQ